MTTVELRQQFPSLGQTVFGRPLVYLDNAATSLRPQSVIDKWVEMASTKNANIHRAVHRLAVEATDEFESTRDVVRDFLNAGSREEIIFTSGTTASVNLLAFCLGEAFIHPGDEILIAECEHHSDIVPWQMMAERKGAVIRTIPVDGSGRLDLQRLRENLSEKTKLTCLAEISNVLGLKNPVKEVVNICHSAGCLVFCDGAQGVVHSAADVRATGVDFYAFSGHKIYAATGTGVLYGRKELLDQMPPYMGGGEMIGSVSFTKTTYAPLPGKFEAGTQNLSAVPTLKPALALAREMRCPEIEAEQRAITDFLLKELAADPDITLYGLPGSPEEKAPLFSFAVRGAHHEDLALILDKLGVAVRSGQMCAEPLMDRYGVTGMVRASFAPYNTLEEAGYFIKALRRALEMLR
jgi:cysteine desulfurase/selenocysteine lyase